MKSWFLKGEYPEKPNENEMRKVNFCKEEIKKAKGYIICCYAAPPIKKSRKNNT